MLNKHHMIDLIHIIFLKEQADLSAADSLPTRGEKLKFVYDQLRTTAIRTQPSLISFLKSGKVIMPSRGMLKSVKYSLPGFVVQRQSLRAR